MAGNVHGLPISRMSNDSWSTTATIHTNKELPLLATSSLLALWPTFTAATALSNTGVLAWLHCLTTATEEKIPPVVLIGLIRTSYGLEDP